MPKSKYQIALLVNEITSRRNHLSQIHTLEESLRLADRLFRGMARAGPEEYKAKPSLQAVHLLFMRSLELMRNSYSCLLTGSYGTSKALSRLVLENSELGMLLGKDISATRKWMKGDQFQPRLVRETLYKGEELRQAARFYSALSDYVHPNAKGWPEYLKVSEQSQMFGLPLYPVYDAKAANEAIMVLVYAIRVTFQSVEDSFRRWLVTISNDVELIVQKLDSLLPES